jgi:hypothetical protein
MKLAIVGSRTFNDYNRMEGYIELIFNNVFNDVYIIVSGGAKGADRLAEKYVETANKYFRYPKGVKKDIYLPEWDKYGKSAGFKRNQQIVDACDMVLAFWDGESKGTKHTIDLAKKAKKPTFIIYF